MSTVSWTSEGTSVDVEEPAIGRDESLQFIKRLLSEAESKAVGDELKRKIFLDPLLRCLMDSTHKEFDLVRKFSVHPTYANFFWGEIASKCLSFESVANESPTWNDEAFSCPHGTKDELKFMQGSRINACYNLLDRNIDLMGLGDKPALFHVPRNWRKDGIKPISYLELKTEVCTVSNVLIKMLNINGGTGEEVGARVLIYLPDYPQLIHVILACFRVGAVPVVVYRGADNDMLIKVIEECKPKLAVTADIASDKAPDEASSMAVTLLTTLQSENSSCIALLMGSGADGTLVKPSYHLPTKLDNLFDEKRHFWYNVISKDVHSDHQCGLFEANHPLFLACTSGSTGIPKIVEHRTLGYLLNVAVVFRCMHLFQVDGPPSSANIKQDVSFCLPTLAWLYGMHSLLLGPLLTGGATVLYEHGASEDGMVADVREIISTKHVTHLFTVPHFLSSFVKHSTSRRVQKQLSTLRYVATAGSVVTESMRKRTIGFCQLMNIYYADTWAQTEAGSCLFMTPPSRFDMPDGRMIPFFGVDATVVDREGYHMDQSCESKGHLVIRMPWPALFSRLMESSSAKERLRKMFPSQSGVYYTGDNAIRHPDETFVIEGREDNTVALVGSDDYQCAVIQLELVEGVLEESAWVEEAIVCRWEAAALDTVVVSGMMAVIRPSEQLQNDRTCQARSAYDEGDDAKFLKSIAIHLNSKVCKKLKIGYSPCSGRSGLLSLIVISGKEFRTTTRGSQGKKDRLRIVKAAQCATELIRTSTESVSDDDLKDCFKQEESLGDANLEVVRL